ncbi:MAG TPA: LLM class flavin-dependent oxidoreductase [Chloroflexota bacterium]|nr:LLM class flavin-dependent oxidoreductase [Chloroflexota bacterium]
MPDPSPLEMSIAFQTNKTPAEYEALALLVDGYGFDVVSVYNDLLFQPALGPLLLMARYLTQTRIGPAVLNPYTVHPLEIAGQVALLDLASQGHAYLGLGRGAWLDALGLETRRPVSTLREAVLLVRHLLARRPEAFDGEVFKLGAGMTLQYEPLRSHVPIMIGTWGPRTAQLAGEVADEIKIGGSANPAVVGHLKPFIEDGLRTAGRRPGSVGVCLGAVTVVDEDREAARAVARREVALYLPVVAPLDPTVTDLEWLDRITSAAGRGDYEAVARDISDDVLDRFAYAGNPEDIVRQVEAIAEGGATRVEFGTPHGIDSTRGIKLLGECVLPALRR